MSVISIPSRVSDAFANSMLVGTLDSNQAALTKLQQQISTGQRLTSPSDNPSAAVGIEQLNTQLANSTQYNSNLQYAGGFLSTADSALTNLTTTLNQAQQIAGAQVGTTSTAAQRSAAAGQVGTLITAALDAANSTYQNAYVFSGTNGTQPAFASVNGGYVYQGSTQNQGIVTQTGSTLNYTVDGNAVFGGLSAQVTGYQNLSPALTAATQLSDLGGATGSGVTGGQISISNGTQNVTVNLSSASSIGDVQNLIQDALTSSGIGGTVSLAGGHLAVTNPSTPLTISNVGNDAVATQLGIAQSVAAGAGITGGNLQPRITSTTPLSALRNGAGIDPTGFIVTNGSTSATITLAGMQTVGDLLNAVNSSGTSVQAQINAAGTGINILNPVSGSAMTIGENGGTTAQELGIRTLQPGTALNTLNNGQGITLASASSSGPSGNIVITKTNGATFSVSLNGITTPGGLVSAINAAAGNGTVTAAFNSSGNGITLTDSSGGAGNLSVTAGTNYIGNGANLGIFKTGAGATLAGTPMSFGTDNFQITQRDGASFTVNVAGAATVQDVLNAINNAGGNSGATKVTAALSATGNGIVLTDASSGSGTFSVTALNGSQAAAQLGIAGSASNATPGTITGTDISGQQPAGVFAGLLMLQQALANNNTAGITQAAGVLQTAQTQVITQHGLVGAREQDIQTRQSELTTQQTQMQTALAALADTNMASAITQLQTLQTAYQASLKTAQIATSQSLWTFIQ